MDEDRISVYHPPALFRFVSYVATETSIAAGSKLQSFHYISDNELGMVGNASSDDFRTYRCRSRKVALVHLPDLSDDSGVGSRAVVCKFGYKNTYTVVAVDLKTGQRHSLVATKKQNVLMWKGGFERIENLRMGSALVMKGGARAVVVSCQYSGYIQVNRVLLRDSLPYFANDFICSNTIPQKRKKPATSYGIIGYRINDAGELQLMVIRRKHTMGFMDMIRARFYNQNVDEIARVYLSEMTQDEKQKIETCTFDELWDEIWVNHKSKSYRNEYLKAKQRYSRLPLAKLAQEVTCKYKVPEYGFPKGRKNRREDCVGCARREFEEETGLCRGHYTLVKSAPVFEERFTATNGMEYRHLYYLAKTSPTAPAPSITAHVKQLEEIGAVEWRTPTECKEIFRPYDTSKKQVTDEVHAYVTSLLSQRATMN